MEINQSANKTTDERSENITACLNLKSINFNEKTLKKTPQFFNHKRYLIIIRFL